MQLAQTLVTNESPRVYGRAEMLLSLMNESSYIEPIHFPDISNPAKSRYARTSESDDISEEFELFPNPANTYTTIEYHLGKKRNAMLVITDVTGKPLHSESISDARGHRTIPLESWNSGVYFCQLLISGEVVSTKRLNIVR